MGAEQGKNGKAVCVTDQLWLWGRLKFLIRRERERDGEEGKVAES